MKQTRRKNAMDKNDEPKLIENEWVDPKTGKTWVALHPKKLGKRKVRLEALGYMKICEMQKIDITGDRIVFTATGIPE
jgi:hypothetical protein